jgi:hypothetical protein
VGVRVGPGFDRPSFRPAIRVGVDFVIAQPQ